MTPTTDRRSGWHFGCWVTWARLRKLSRRRSWPPGAAGHTYDPERGSSRTWLLTLVRNRSIDVIRARRRRPVQQLDETFDLPDSSDVPMQAALNVEAEQVAEAMIKLPIEQRETLELAYVSGLSHAEIAAQVGVPVGTVKGRIRLGLDRLRQALGVPR